MKWVRFTVVVLLGAVLQTGLVNLFSLGNSRPDLMLILLVFFCIYSSTEDAIITSFVIGFTADLIGPAMGPKMLSFGIIGTLLAYLHRVIAMRNMVYQGMAIFLMGIITGTTAHFLTSLKSSSATSGIIINVFAEPFYSAVVGPFLFLPIAWIMGIRTSQFRKL